jgi:hypothetical protein
MYQGGRLAERFAAKFMARSIRSADNTAGCSKWVFQRKFHILNSSAPYELCSRPSYTSRIHNPRPVGWHGAQTRLPVWGVGDCWIVKITHNNRFMAQKVTGQTGLACFLVEFG